jgi:glycosyltransferase involved in cell wall biosynthesis
MKIVDVNPYFYPLMGGIEHRMHLIAKEMSARGHEVYIVTGQLPGTKLREETPDGYTVIRLPSHYIKMYNPPYIFTTGVLKALNDIGADIVNFNYRWAPSYTFALGQYKGKKTFTYHNMWGEGVGFQHALSSANDFMFNRTMKKFDHVIAVSDFVRSDLISHGVPPEFVTTATPCLQDYPEMREDDDGFILSLGRLVPTKGLDYLMEAMCEVNFKLVLCGMGPDESKLRHEIERYGIGDRVEMRGWVSEDEKHRLMSSCKFFVMPSLYESYGLAALEQMAYGRPIVCTNVNGLPSTVKDGGIVVEPRDPKALAEAMNRLINDQKQCREIGHKARAVAETQTVGATVDVIEKVYNDVLSH